MTGALIYIPATNTSSVFNIARACSIYSTNIIKNCYIEQCYKLISNISICYVARYINVMPIFARACGSSCKLLAFKLLNILSIRTIQLPSGKLTRIDSTVPVITGYILPRHKEKYKNTRAGYSSKLGRKPQVRGVVKNPIDHPHGGRARTVSKPRSP
jgi:ribosomal protein L2